MAGQKGSEKDACKTEACSIQTCLSKNGYNVSQCSHQVDRLKKCCEKHQARPLVLPCNFLCKESCLCVVLLPCLLLNAPLTRYR